MCTVRNGVWDGVEYEVRMFSLRWELDLGYDGPIASILDADSGGKLICKLYKWSPKAVPATPAPPGALEDGGSGSSGGGDAVGEVPGPPGATSGDGCGDPADDHPMDEALLAALTEEMMLEAGGLGDECEDAPLTGDAEEFIEAYEAKAVASLAKDQTI